MRTRTVEFGSKSRMWHDIGLGEWLFDFDSAADRERFPAATLRMFTEEEHTGKLVERAQNILREKFCFFGDFLKKRYT